MPDVPKTLNPSPHAAKQNAEACKVFSFFSKQEIDISSSTRAIAIYPEASNLKMLYKNSLNQERCIAVPIVCWAMLANGSVVGLVPWLDGVMDCRTIADRFDIYWEGYYNVVSGEIMAEPPESVVELLTVQLRFTTRDNADKTNQVIQEISDQVGTHAMLLDESSESLTLTAVVSWQLQHNGEVVGMLADESQPHKYPILAQDSCLYRANESNTFRCYFQRDIAEQIRHRDPDTLDAIERMFL